MVREEYEWEIEVIGFNKDNEVPERFCRNGEECGALLCRLEKYY